jgi:gas vesicle protein
LWRESKIIQIMSKKRSNSNSSGVFIGGFLIGAAVGTVAGLLSAPRSGRETRQLLKKSADALPELAEDLTTSVQLQMGRLSESALRKWDETLIRLKEAIADGVEASQQVRTLDASAPPAPRSGLTNLYPLSEVKSRKPLAEPNPNLPEGLPFPNLHPDRDR